VEATRRQALTGALVTTAGLLAACTRPSGGVARETDGTLTSTHWPGRSVRWRLALPDPTRWPAPRLVVALHGKGGNADDAWGLGLADRAGELGLALASVDGGDTYYHQRRDGTDVGAMIVQDLVPVLRTAGAGAGPVGLIGWSMGGYGALWLAAHHGPAVVGAAAGMSSALWTSPGSSAPGAFDDRADFLAHDVFALGPALAKVPLHLDCGTGDPFIAADRAFARVVPHAVTTFDAGAHDDAYWRPHGLRALDWLGATLPAWTG